MADGYDAQTTFIQRSGGTAWAEHSDAIRLAIAVRCGHVRNPRPSDNDPLFPGWPKRPRSDQDRGVRDQSPTCRDGGRSELSCGSQVSTPAPIPQAHYGKAGTTRRLADNAQKPLAVPHSRGNANATVTRSGLCTGSGYFKNTLGESK